MASKVDQPSSRPFGMVSVLITGRCNRRCPSCTFRQVTDERKDLPPEYFRKAGPLIGHVRRVCVSGGEPLLHRQLVEAVRAIKESFDYGEIFLATNGDLLSRHPEIVGEFDSIRVPILDERTFPGCPSNAAARAQDREICRAAGVPLFEHGPGEDSPTVHWDRPGLSPWDCQGYFATILWDGRLFPCCMPLGPGVELTPGLDWRSEVRKLPLPCDRCYLSSAADVERARSGRAFG
jgi:hypothetical protein